MEDANKDKGRRETVGGNRVWRELAVTLAVAEHLFTRIFQLARMIKTIAGLIARSVKTVASLAMVVDAKKRFHLIITLLAHQKFPTLSSNMPLATGKRRSRT